MRPRRLQRRERLIQHFLQLWVLHVQLLMELGPTARHELVDVRKGKRLYHFTRPPTQLLLVPVNPQIALSRQYIGEIALAKAATEGFAHLEDKAQLQALVLELEQGKTNGME